MKTFLMKHTSLIPFLLMLVLSIFWLIFIYVGSWNRLFITSDQLGYRYYEKKLYIKAAETFENAAFKGAALYRDAAFKKAKSIYLNFSDKKGKYNLGNASVMLGEYDTAIEAYTLALKMDPNFKEAKANLLIAKARKILKEPENDGKQGIGDMYDMQPDDVVYDNEEGKGEDDTRSAQKDAEKGNPNWLDRLQTGPKDFLKNKFRYQYEMKEGNDAK